MDTVGEERLVAFFIWKLLPCEKKYTTAEKKYLVIKFGIEAFRVYLLGRTFTVSTVQRSLEWLGWMHESNS